MKGGTKRKMPDKTHASRKMTNVMTDQPNPLHPIVRREDLETLSVNQLLSLHDSLMEADEEYNALRADRRNMTPAEADAFFREMLARPTVPWADVIAREWVSEADAASNLEALRGAIVRGVMHMIESGAPAQPFRKHETLMSLMESTSATVRAGAFRQRIADLSSLSRDHERANAAIDFLVADDQAKATVALRRAMCVTAGAPGAEILHIKPVSPPVPPDEYIGRAHFYKMLQPPRGSERACVNGETCACMNESRPWLSIAGAEAPREPCREYLPPWHGASAPAPSGPAGPCLWCILRNYERLWVAFTTSVDAPPMAPGHAFNMGDGPDDFPESYFYPAYLGTGHAYPTGMGRVIMASRFHIEYTPDGPRTYRISVHFFVPRRGWHAPRGSRSPPLPSSAATL